MQTLIITAALLALTTAAYRYGIARAFAGGPTNRRRLHSLPGFYGAYAVLWSAGPALVVFGLWLAAGPALIDAALITRLPESVQQLPEAQLSMKLAEIRDVASGSTRPADAQVMAAAESYRSLRDRVFWGAVALAAAGSLAGLVFARGRIGPAFRARNRVERAVLRALLAASVISIVTTIAIVLSLLFEALRFFAAIAPVDFLFGLQWSPQMALRADQVGAFGAVPVFAGTLLITLLAMLVSVPLGLMSAIYMAEYASPRLRAIVKPALEILAGIPTVVYGFIAALTIGPAIRAAGETLGIDVASESALAAGLVMGVMIIPFVSSLSDDVIHAVPQSLRDGSLAMGATRSETIIKVVIPAALPGIMGSVLLAISRAIGETMIVVMAAGLSANLTANPFEAVTTVTVQIVTLLVGDQEFDSPKTLAAFALGLVLFAVTLVFNVIALVVVRRFRERYD